MPDAQRAKIGGIARGVAEALGMNDWKKVI